MGDVLEFKQQLRYELWLLWISKKSHIMDIEIVNLA